jgi:hypothetical protein
MQIREEFGLWFTGKKRSDEKKIPCAASRLRSGSLRSPLLRREAAHPPQSVTHAVITKCYLCDAQIPSLALPGWWMGLRLGRRACAHRMGYRG